MRALKDFLRGALDVTLFHWELLEEGFDDDTVHVGIDMGWLRLVPGKLGTYRIDTRSIS